jgi:hypothetical protein
MVPISHTTKAIHTENGIYGATPLITGLPVPHCEIHTIELKSSDDIEAITEKHEPKHETKHEGKFP